MPDFRVGPRQYFRRRVEPVEAERLPRGRVGALHRPKRLHKELVAFFEATSALQKKDVEVIDWAGPKRARAILDDAIALAKKKDAAA